MPTIGEFHAKYWGRKFNAPPVPRIPQAYPGWQGSVILPSLFGVIGARWDAWRAQLRWWWALYRRISGLGALQQQVLLKALTLLESPAYGAAKTAVRATAVTPGFNRPEAWLDYSREVKSEPNRAENMFRHLRAMRLVRDAQPGLSNPDQNLLVELAYHEYAIRPWGN